MLKKRLTFSLSLLFMLGVATFILIGVGAQESSGLSKDSPLATLTKPLSLTAQATTSNEPARQNEVTHKSLKSAIIDKILVDKSEQSMHLMAAGQIIKTYPIALGDQPKGHKTQEGDERTPEGTYTLDYKNENSIAYRSIHISYPNDKDVSYAKSLGVSPGGDIMIHGQMNGYESIQEVMQQQNWTDGCIAVTNEEMDEIMEAVKIGTPIEIVW